MCCRRGRSVRLRSTSNTGDFDRVLALFKKEARALAQMAHPNVVGVHQIFEENGTAYMALDYVEGPDLLDVVGRRQFTFGSSLASCVHAHLDGVALHLIVEREHRDSVRRLFELVTEKPRIDIHDFAVLVYEVVDLSND